MQLITKDLSKQYEKSEGFALNKVNLNIRKGEFIAILGLSGSGKSTFIRCINRLIDPTMGKIYFEDKDVTCLKREDLRIHRKNIGMIFQQYNLIPRLDVITNVLVGKFGSLSTKQILFKKFPNGAMEEAEIALRKVGLENFSKRKVKTLSGGQQQRVGIARALIQNPQIILGDEPVSSLDPVTAREVMTLLKGINEKENITMIINLHSVELAKAFAERIIGLKEGKVVFDGAPGDLSEENIKGIYK